MKKIISKIMSMIELHKWFCRESQHYVLGYWYCYCSFDEKLDYCIRFPLAWVRFMWASWLMRGESL